MWRWSPRAGGALQCEDTLGGKRVADGEEDGRGGAPGLVDGRATGGVSSVLFFPHTGMLKARERCDRFGCDKGPARSLSDYSNFFSDRGKLEKITGGIYLIFRG